MINGLIRTLIKLMKLAMAGNLIHNASWKINPDIMKP